MRRHQAKKQLDRKQPHKKRTARKSPHRQPCRKTSLTSRKVIRAPLQRKRCRPNLTCATFRSKDPGSFLRSGSRIGPTAAAEISILGSGLAQDDGYTAETFNLSEKHLSFFAYTALNDPEDPQNGEGKKSSVPLTGSQKMQGGDPQFVTWLYASGIGPNLEDRSGLDEGDEEVLV